MPVFNSESPFPTVLVQGDIGTLTTPHSKHSNSHLKPNNRNGLQKSCNSSDLAAPGNAKFIESGYHFLVIFTKISGSLKILKQVLPHNTIDNTSIHIQMETFVFPSPTRGKGKEWAAQWVTEKLIGLSNLILSSILTPALRWGKHISHSVAKHFELFLKYLTSTTKIAKMGYLVGIFGQNTRPHLTAFSCLLSVLYRWSLAPSKKGVK